MLAKFARKIRSAGGILGVAAVLGFGLAKPAMACELEVEAPQAVRIDYNPFAVGVSTGPLDIVFRDRSGNACELKLRLVDDLGDPRPDVTIGGVVVEFRPREAYGVFLRDLEPGVFLLSVPANGIARAEIDAAVVQNAVVDAGDHIAELRLAIEGADGQPAAATVPLSVLLHSTPRAQVNIAGSAGVFGSGSSVEVVDFGSAATGLVRRVFLQVRANADSTLTVRSEHRGMLRHVEEGEKGTVIAYGVELDGQPVDLSETWTRQVDPPRTSEGVSLPMDFTLGNVSGQMSGRYEDLLTIDISPN